MYYNILTQLKSILDSVTGIGETFDYLKLSHDEQGNISLFVNTSIYHSWFITRSKCLSELYENKFVLRIHSFDIHGIYAQKTTSEKTFNALVGTVLNEFQKETNINLLTNSRLIEVPERADIQEQEFTNVLCQWVTIPLTIEETKAIERFYFDDWADGIWVLDDNEFDKNHLDIGY